MRLTLSVKKTKLVCYSQNEVENIALVTLGTSRNIYFDHIPITLDHELIWSDKEDGWILKIKL